jgi:hypothetical protein
VRKWRVTRVDVHEPPWCWSFWFRRNAEAYARKHKPYAFLYERKWDQWVERSFT